MGRKSVAKKLEWRISDLGLILFERHVDCWRIVRNVQSVPPCVNGRRTVDIIPINCESLGYCRGAWISLDVDMVRIDDKVRLDALVNPVRNFSQVRMSNLNESAASEVDELLSKESSSTS